METNTIIVGEALEELKKLPDESIDCVVTSPPYWGLRAYGTNPAIWDGDPACKHDWSSQERRLHGGTVTTAKVGSVKSGAAKTDWTTTDHFCNKCGAWKGELGLEPDFRMFIKHLCDIFDEVKRVLKKTGTCWVNLGDTYGGSGGPGGDHERMGDITAIKGKNPNRTLTPKSLVQIPSRFAIEMTDRGWCLRNEVIWYKKNVMPQSVKDRFTVDFEKIFFFTKSKKYYFEQQFERGEMTAGQSAGSNQRDTGETHGVGGGNSGINAAKEKLARELAEKGYTERNKRAVWQINPQPFSEAHFAVYPPKLCETPIKAGSPPGGVVLDPFFGSGTTGLVAEKLGRRWIGIELNDEYAKIARKRTSQQGLL